MILTTTGNFVIILAVCVFVAWVIGYQWAYESLKKEGGTNNENRRIIKR